MITITQHIEYLMMYNDCVVVPGWGALIANYAPSQLQGDTMLKPRRSIGFNPSITHNDGLLATSIARRHGISYNEACNVIATGVASFKSQMATGSEVAFGRLGLFKLNGRGKMEFEPFSQDEAFNEFFGLHDLKLSTINQATSSPQVIITGNLWHERMKAAASVAAILAVGVLFSTPVIIDRSTQSASMNVVEVKTKPAQVVSVKPATTATATDNKITVLDDKATQAVSSKKQVQEDDDVFNPGMPSDLHGSRLLVINTCHRASQAQKMVKRYAKKGIKTRVVNSGKQHLIVVAQSNSEKELRRAKALLPSSCQRAWISRR